MLAMEPRSTGAPSADTDNTLGQSASGIITSIISTDISSPAETCQKPELPTSHREGSKTNFSPWEMTGGELQGEKKKRKKWRRGTPHKTTADFLCQSLFHGFQHGKGKYGSMLNIYMFNIFIC